MLSRILGREPETSGNTSISLTNETEGCCGDCRCCDYCPCCGRPYWPGTQFPSYPQIVWTTC